MGNTVWFFCLIYCVGIVSAEESCYGAGSIATSVVLSVIITLVIIGAAICWIRRKPKSEHLILETDPEKGTAEYAFDNPGFKDAGLTPLSKSLEKSSSKFDAEKPGKQKWNHWPGLSALTIKSEKRKTLDDSIIGDNEHVKVVALRSHDFTGLGFNICGNMKEGIYIKDILHRGPASESGKLNPGDRINSVTISFEHIVYEDALTILSYASPYEVMIEAKSGKIQIGSNTKSNHPIHPIYKSSSSTDLHQVEKSARRKLYSENSMESNYSTMHKSISNMTTLERTSPTSPKLDQINLTQSQNNTLNSEQLKNELEQKITSAETEARIKNEPGKTDMEIQKTENKHQKFGIKVFPTDQQKNLKTAELSQNDNNVNIEKNKSYDQVDTSKLQTERSKSTNEEQYFNRDGSGLKRDSNGIPQEIPSHILNAAVAARRNRKSFDELLTNDDETKTPKKSKGKAPPPPPDEKNKDSNKLTHSNDLDEIKQADEVKTELTTPASQLPTETSLDQSETSSKKSSFKEYNSDSEEETDKHSSVNTIELNSSDITIHHEENEEKQNRKTASTGDLTKIHRTRKSSSGTLERAQSLDITDSGIPTLTKKRKGGRIEDAFDLKSDEDSFGKTMLNKEPRLSLILDGLNTFQRNRLKKSTEWGNLEDAILKSSQDGTTISPVFTQNTSAENLTFNFGEKSAELDAVVNRINEIRRESQEINEIKIEASNDPKETRDPENIPKNEIWPSDIQTPVEITVMHPITVRSKVGTSSTTVDPQTPKVKVQNEIWPKELEQHPQDGSRMTNEIKLEEINSNGKEMNFDSKIQQMQPKTQINEQDKPETILVKTLIQNVESKDNKNTNSMRQTMRAETLNVNLGNTNIDTPLPVITTNKTTHDDVSHRDTPAANPAVLIGTITKTVLDSNMIAPETYQRKTPEFNDKKPIMQTDLDDLTDVELEIHNSDESNSNINKIEISPDRITVSSDNIKIHKRQQIPNSVDEIPLPPEMAESNLEQEIFDELRRNHSSPEVPERKSSSARIFASEVFNNHTPTVDVLYRTNGNHSGVKRNSETGELCTNVNNTDESKTMNDINPRYLNDTESFIFNERYVCSQDEPNEIIPEDTNISDDIKVSRHSLGSLERAKCDDAKSIESLQYLTNVSNVTINSVQTENGSSSLHSLEFSVNEPTEERNLSRLSDKSELYTTALNKTVKPDRDTSKISISTPDLIKNVSIAEAINTLNNDMDQSVNYDFDTRVEKKQSTSEDDTPTNSVSDKTIEMNGENKNNFDSGKNHSSLTYITEIQVTPNNGNTNISEIQVLPTINTETNHYSKNIDNEFENYVKNFEVKTPDTIKGITIKNEDVKEKHDVINSVKIDPEKELHKIQEIAQEQLKKLPEMRFSTSSYESPSRIPEKRQSQIELLKSNFEKSPPKSLKTEIATKSRIPISTTMTMKTPPTSPERRDSRNLDMENEQEILELMSSTVHSTPMTNSLKYQKTPNKNITITSIRNNSKIPSGLPVLGGNRPPIPPRKPEQDNDSIVHVSTNNSNINSFKQWVFDPIDSVTNISLSGQRQEHK